MTFDIIIFLKISLEFFKSVRRYGELFCQYYLFSSIFINFLDFLTFPCYKKTKGVSLSKMISAFFQLQPVLNKKFFLQFYKVTLTLNKFFITVKRQCGRYNGPNFVIIVVYSAMIVSGWVVVAWGRKFYLGSWYVCLRKVSWMRVWSMVAWVVTSLLGS